MHGLAIRVEFPRRVVGKLRDMGGEVLALVESVRKELQAVNANILAHPYLQALQAGRIGRERRLRELAMALQPKRGATIWAFNQALMELGALVCTARSPNCPSCPVRADCAWHRSVSASRLPTP